MFNTIYVVIGLLTGALTGFTGGSGMSILMSSLLLFNQDIRSIIGITFFVTLFNSIAALPAYVKSKNISLRDSLLIGVPGFFSVFPGFYFSQRIRSEYILWTMIVALFLMGVKFVFARGTAKKESIGEPINSAPLLLLFGLAIGFCIGIFGGGGGIFIGVLLILFFRYRVKRAVGISIFVMGLVALSGILINMREGIVDPKILLLITIPSVISSFIISRIANRVDPKVIKTILGIYLLLATVALALKKIIW